MKRRINRNPLLKQLRRDQADERAVRREALTVSEQLQILDERPGNSAKERARLLKRRVKDD